MRDRLARDSLLVGGVIGLALGVAAGCGTSTPPSLTSAGGNAAAAGASQCQRTLDCAPAQVCSPDGRCVACYADVDCKANEHCAQEVCVETVACQSAGDCAQSQTCTAGQCEPIVSCQKAADCAAGYSCNSQGVCVACGDPTCGVTSAGGSSGAGAGGVSGAGNIGGTAGAGAGGVSGAGNIGGVAGGGASAGSAGTGSGGAGAAGGASGTSGMSGSAGAGGTGAPGTQIVSSYGMVLAGTNDVGVNGPWATDYPAGSTVNYITPSPAFASAGSQVCVAGFVGGGGTPTEWGASLYLLLDEQTDSYTPASHGVLGFGFTVTGSNIPAHLQLDYIQADGSAYCTLMVAGPGAHTFKFSDATYDCWTSGGAVATAQMSFEQFWIQVPSSVGSYSFNFCLTDVYAIVE
ncbi:MAG TPA: hypothetical protein VGI10_14905 [Polyangiaceae bacterium]